MRSSRPGQRTVALLVGVGFLAAAGCQTHDQPAAPPPGSTASSAAAPAAKQAEPLRDEIPAAELGAVLEAHFQGMGYMEQYEYGKAAKAFREVRRRAPGWIPGSINMSIALLNMTGEEVEASKKSGGAQDLAISMRLYSFWPASSSGSQTTLTPISAPASSSSNRATCRPLTSTFAA